MAALKIASSWGAIIASITAICIVTSRVICKRPTQSTIVSKIDVTRNYGSIHESLIKFLFGDQWPLGEYCSSKLSASEKVSNDAQIESLYNGTYLGVLEGSTDWSKVPAKIAATVGLSLKSRRELAIFCPVSAWGYASSTDERLANEPSINDRKCAQQIERLYDFVVSLLRQTGCAKCQGSTSSSSCASASTHNHSSSQAESRRLKFQLHHYNQFHSFGRLPSGPPHKQNLLLGDYENCARLESTRYCLGSYGDSRNTDESILYHIGLCLPRACSDKFLRQSARHVRMLNSIVEANLIDSAIPRDDHQLQDIFCPPAPDSLYMKLTKDHISIVLLCIILPWTLLLIYATLIRSGARSKRAIISSFDLLHNWRAFTDSRDLDCQLSGLSGVKTLAMIWLMLTHFSMTIFPYVKNLNELDLYYKSSFQGPLILQGQHIVPSFFIISGLLVGFKYLRRRKQPVDFKHMILWRYFRLMPMYLLFWVYIRQFAHLIGEGPLWDSGVSPQSEVRQCIVEAWWVPLLMLANFTPPYAHCLITGWHIANDFQIYLLLPALLLAYKSSRSLGRLLVVGVFLLSHLSHMWLWGTSENFDLLQVVRDPSRFGPRLILERMSFDYVNPFGRVGTYFLGVLVADFLIERTKRTGENAECHHKSGLIRATNFLACGQISPCRRDGIKPNRASCSSLTQRDEHHHEGAHGQTQEHSDQRRRSSSVIESALISVEASIAGDEAGERRQARKHEPTDENNSARAVESREESVGMINTRATNARLVSGERDITDNAVVVAAPARQGLADFKDKCVLVLSLCNFFLVMFTIALSPDQVPSFGDYTKAIAYPACRISIELSWSILLYYLLRSNIPDSAGGDQADNKETLAARDPGATEPATNKPRAIDENDPLMMATTRAAKPAGPPTTAALTTAQAESVPVAPTSRENQEKFTIARAGLARFFKLPMWNILVKLNYALMLTHYALMRFVIQTQRDLFQFTWANFFQFTTFLVLACYLLALLVHLAVEMPLSALVKRLVERAFTTRARPRIND